VNVAEQNGLLEEGEGMELQDLGAEPQIESGGQATELDIDALYQRSLLRFQDGHWQEALDGFEEVLRLNPEHVEARVFLDEARLKASLDEDRPRPKRILLQGRVRSLALILAALSAVVVLITGVRWAYGRWVTPRQTAQQEETIKSQELEKAYGYLARRDYAAAEEAFRAVLAEDPDNQEAQEGLDEVQKRSALDETYADAQQAISKEDWDEALRLLAIIVSQDPGYRDAHEKQLSVQEQQRIGTSFDEAEIAYAAGNWSEAIASYESLRDSDLQYERQTVTDHLFDSYLQQGIYLIESTSGESEAVQEATALYQKALALRPQDPQVKQEMALAEKYLEAQTRLTQGDSEGALTALKWVYEQEPAYAGGNVAALLKATGGGDVIVAPVAGSPEGSFQAQYARSMQGGDVALAADDYAQAEEHYRQAATIAIHGGYDSARWLFASYAKLGTAQARNGNYDRAVEALKTAILVMAKSAVAIPSSSYADYAEQGDRYAQSKDYQDAFAQYDKALQALGQKCNCGLANWSVLP
jgi:tetratricopeptide (TPR) repeat protein